jgi:hypothetical protein
MTTKSIVVVCVSIAAALMLLASGFAFFIFHLLGTSDAATLAVARAERDPKVIAALGSPMTTGMVTTGSVETNNSSGEARLSIPISGPRGSGRLGVLASRENRRWTLRRLVLTVDGKSVELMDDEAASTPPASASPLASAFTLPSATANVATLPEPTITDGDVRVTGALSADIVKRVVHGLLEQFRVCYRTALRKDPTLRGTMTFAFGIDTMGRVRDAVVARSTVADPDVVACSIAHLRSVTFPPPERGSATVTYALVLAP